MTKTAYIHLYDPIDAQLIKDIHYLLLNDIDPEIKRLHLIMCTDGGSVAHGIALYNLLRASPYEIVTHNIGNVDSIGIVVFLAGFERYAEENATFMIHPVKSTLKTRQMSYDTVKEKISAIETDTQRIKKIFQEHTTIPVGELNDLFKAGQVKTATDAIKIGLIHSVKPIPFDVHAEKRIVKAKDSS